MLISGGHKNGAEEPRYRPQIQPGALGGKEVQLDPDASISRSFGGENNYPRRLAREMWTDSLWASLVRRFGEKIAEGEWTGRIYPNGYGRIWTGLKSPRHASPHVIAYVIAYGGRPAGFEVHHSCEWGKLCVNTSHLYLYPAATPDQPDQQAA